MSRFGCARLARLTPYVPGEQPRDRRYVKLNTNESPFPPAPGVERAVLAEARQLQLYSDPASTALREAMAARYGVAFEEVMMTNGSDEALDFAFAAFADGSRPLVFPDVTYGFYAVLAARHGIPCRQVPLREDFTINPDDYLRPGETVVLANPNAPTGLALPTSAIERILAADPDRLVIVDEAYVDFGGESCVPLTRRYENLLVTGTFSKSRSLAGGRLGFAIGSRGLIADMQTVQYAANPYNVNRMTAAAGLASLADETYFRTCRDAVVAERARTEEALEKEGFFVLPSKTNFLFASHPRVEGGTLFARLREAGILVRHFDAPRTRRYIRVTVGTHEEMDTFLAAAARLTKED